MSERGVNILGVGNVLMGDDGVGCAVAATLLRRGVPDKVHVYDAGLAVADVLSTLDPGAPLIVVDAVRADGAPGSVYKVVLAELTLAEAAFAARLSLHEISVLPALRIEAMSGRLFRDVVVIGVEPDAIEWGISLSPAVAAGVDKAAAGVLAEADARLACLAMGETAA